MSTLHCYIQEATCALVSLKYSPVTVSKVNALASLAQTWDSPPPWGFRPWFSPDLPMPTSADSLLGRARALPISSGNLAGYGFRLSDLEDPKYATELARYSNSRPATADGKICKTFAQAVLALRALEEAISPGPSGPPALPGPPPTPAPKAGPPRTLAAKAPNLPVLQALPPPPVQTPSTPTRSAIAWTSDGLSALVRLLPSSLRQIAWFVLLVCGLSVVRLLLGWTLTLITRPDVAAGYLTKTLAWIPWYLMQVLWHVAVPPQLLPPAIAASEPATDPADPPPPIFSRPFVFSPGGSPRFGLGMVGLADSSA